MRLSILIGTMFLLAMPCAGESGCPRVFPSALHLYLPAQLPPGSYPSAYDSAFVWVFCDTAPPSGVTFTAEVTGSRLVGIEWVAGPAQRASETTWQNLSIRALNRAVSPAKGTQEAVVEITAEGVVARLPVSVTVTDSPFLKLRDPTIPISEVDYAVNSALWFPNAVAAMPFTLVPESSSWLAVSPSGGSGYTDFSLRRTSESLAGGEYFGAVIATSPGAVNSPLRVPVRLSYKPGGLSATPASLATTVFITATAPRQKTLDLLINYSPGTAVPFTIESDAWFLSASPSSGVTPAHIAVTVDGYTVPLGTIRGDLNVYSPASATLSVPVTLTVAAGNYLWVTPAALNFFTWPGKRVQTLDQPYLSVKSTTPLTAKVEPPAWLSSIPMPASTITTPKDIQYSIRWDLLNPKPSASLPSGTFTGVITVSSDAATNSTVRAAVNAYSLATAPLTASPEYVSFSGSNPPPQTVSVTSATPTSFTVSVPASTATWLAISSMSATTPATLTFTQKGARTAGAPSPQTVTLYAALPGLPPVPVYVDVF